MRCSLKPPSRKEISLRHIIFTLVVVAVLAALPAAAAEPVGQTWTGVTVATTEGWNMPDCTVQWLDGGQKVRVTRQDGTWRDFDPWLVSSVKNALGADITNEVAAARPGGGRAAPPPPATQPQDYGEIGVPADPGAAAATGGLGGEAPPEPKLFTTMFTAGVGYGGYAGDWYQGFQSSLSLHGDIRICNQGKQWFVVGYRRQGGGEEEGYVDVDGLGDYRRLTAKVRVDMFRMGAGGRTGKTNERGAFMYLEGAFLALRHVAEVELEGYGSDDYSETKLGAQILIGGIAPLGASGVLDISADIVVKDTILHSDESGGFVFGARVGVGFVSW